MKKNNITENFNNTNQVKKDMKVYENGPIDIGDDIII